MVIRITREMIILLTSGELVVIMVAAIKQPRIRKPEYRVRRFVWKTQGKTSG